MVFAAERRIVAVLRAVSWWQCDEHGNPGSPGPRTAVGYVCQINPWTQLGLLSAYIQRIISILVDQTQEFQLLIISIVVVASVNVFDVTIFCATITSLVLIYTQTSNHVVYPITIAP